jgi:glycosyltransferase involved in cell wall biosynthesis
VRVVLFEDGPLVEQLRQSGHVVDVFALRGAVGAQSRALAAGAVAVSTMRVLPFVARLAWQLRSWRPDVVHTTSLKADLLGLAAGRLAHSPVVWHVHDRIASDYLPAAVVRAFRAAARWGPAAVVANSAATAETLPGARALTVVHPGLAPEQIVADVEDRKGPAHPVVGLVGRISPTKGQLEFVRAAAEVVSRRPEVRFQVTGSALFGESAYDALVHAEVDRLGLGPALTYTGFQEDPAAVMDGLTVCVHASPVPEPFGQVVIEAMARGVPVVATSAGAIPEILDGGRLGYLARPGDVHDLARAIERALDDPRRSDVVRAAWKEVKIRYTARQSADAILAIWQGIAARQG